MKYYERDDIRKPFWFKWLSADQMEKLANVVGKLTKWPYKKKRSVYDKIKFY